MPQLNTNMEDRRMKGSDRKDLFSSLIVIFFLSTRYKFESLSGTSNSSIKTQLCFLE